MKKTISAFIYLLSIVSLAIAFSSLPYGFMTLKHGSLIELSREFYIILLGWGLPLSIFGVFKLRHNYSVTKSSAGLVGKEKWVKSQKVILFLLAITIIALAIKTNLFTLFFCASLTSIWLMNSKVGYDNDFI